ncbi:MAG: SDR family NAD(P)-dependent oxidoreductase [Candidatus Binatia bacterium]
MSDEDIDGRLDGKVAIVTGAGQGIGRAIALVYARAGARVVVAEWKVHRLERTVEEIRAEGHSAFGVPTDVSKHEQIRAMIAKTVSHFGQLDILVNNAQSFAPRAPLLDITEEHLDMFLDSGIKGTLWAMQGAYPHMKGRGGRIINFVSASGMKGEPGLGAYNATKEGIRALTRTAAREWGKDGILVNAIAPAAMSKRGQDYQARDPEAFAQAMAERPIGRLGDPETDVAPVALFLAGAGSRFLTGHTFLVDGGAHIWA